MIWVENIKLSKISIRYYRAKATRRCLLVFLVVATAGALYSYINYLEVSELEERVKGDNNEIQRLSATNQQALNYQSAIQGYESQLNKIQSFLSQEQDVAGLMASIIAIKPAAINIAEISLHKNSKLKSTIPFALKIQGVTTDLQAIEIYKESIIEILGADHELETTASLLSTYNYNYSINSVISQ